MQCNIFPPPQAKPKKLRGKEEQACDRSPAPIPACPPPPARPSSSSSSSSHRRPLPRASRLPRRGQAGDCVSRGENLRWAPTDAPSPPPPLCTGTPTEGPPGACGASCDPVPRRRRPCCAAPRAATPPRGSAAAPPPTPEEVDAELRPARDWTPGPRPALARADGRARDVLPDGAVHNRLRVPVDPNDASRGVHEDCAAVWAPGKARVGRPPLGERPVPRRVVRAAGAP